MNTSSTPASTQPSEFFRLKEFGTNVPTEIIAGISTYLSLAYIFIVNPAILSKTGIDPSAVLFATVVVSGISTILMGLVARLPFAVAPGLEMNGFFAFVVCGTLGFTWQQGLGTVFVSGVLCLLFTATKVRLLIIDAMPLGLKRSIGTSVGAFVATIGLFLAHIVAFKNGTIDFAALSPTSLTSNLAYVLYVGLMISVALGWRRLKFPGGMLVALIVGATMCWYFGVAVSAPPKLSSKMFSAIGKLDLFVFLNPRFWSPILVFFIVDFLGGIGKIIGLTSNTNIQDKSGNVPTIQNALYVDSGATVAGALVGTSSLIAFVESAVGIQAGGRTGLTAITCGVLMLGSLVFTPVLGLVPAESAAGVLVYVGYLLLPWRQGAKSEISIGRFDIVISLVMAAITFLTFALDKPLAFGFWAYFLKSVVDRKPIWWLGLIAAVLTATIGWQILIPATG